MSGRPGPLRPARLVPDAWLLGWAAANAAGAAALASLHFVWACVGVLVLAVLDCAALAAWTYRDASGRGLRGLAWAAACVAWPVSVPAYLAFSRGGRGLAAAALVAGSFLLLPAAAAFSVRDLVRSSLALRRGRELMARAEASGEGPLKARAMEAFRRSVELDEAEWGGYEGLFRAAADLGRLPETREAFERLDKLPARRRLTLPGRLRWHLAAMTYRSAGLADSIARAKAARASGDAGEALRQAAAALEHWDGAQELALSWKDAPGGLRASRSDGLRSAAGRMDSLVAGLASAEADIAACRSVVERRRDSTRPLIHRGGQ